MIEILDSIHKKSKTQDFSIKFDVIQLVECERK